ncbi:hypothetical protein [Thalassolituus sp.]|jgi:hypothetical protein|uniref:hypothetical protein n=1 Tax=Thalassolituus sp. TaxID=2030822 RepID=UPI0032D8FBB8
MSNYVLLTTSIVSTDNFKLKRMIDSIRDYEEDVDVNIRHILLLQNVSIEQSEVLKETLRLPIWTELLIEPSVISLSKARNIMLKYLFNGQLINNEIVAFPDDDCWYPSGLLKFIGNTFAKNQSEFFFCRYATQTELATFVPKLQVPSYKDLVFNASSNTIFIQGSLLTTIGLFNEELGVGAKFNGGEDLDYAIRTFRITQKRHWVDAPLVGHRDKLDELKGDYFTGSARVLRSNAFYSPASMYHFLRKILIGIYLICKGEMSIGNLYQVFERSNKDA